MTFEEKTLDSETIYKGAVVKLRKDRVTVRTGESYREIVEHGGGAVIIAMKDNGNVIMVKQFRKAAERVMFELPAGKIDPGESFETTAVRELREETGYTADRVQFLTKMYPSIGYSTEALYIYLCTGLTPGETDFDENEAIDISEYPLDELYHMVMNGEIEDGKSQVGILMAKSLYEEGKLDDYIKRGEER